MIEINSCALFRRIDERITDLQMLQTSDERKSLIADIIRSYCKDGSLKDPVLNKEDYETLIQIINNDKVLLFQDEDLLALQYYIYSILADINVNTARLHFEE